MGSPKTPQIKLKDIIRHKFTNIFATTGLVLGLGIAFLIVSLLLKADSTEFCLHILKQEVLEAKRDINRKIASFEENLDALADKLAEMDSLEDEKVQDFLKLYKDRDDAVHIGILFPDNRIMQDDGTFIKAEDGKTFDEEAQRGFQKLDNSALYYVTPIKSNGVTRAVLYEGLELENLLSQFEEGTFFGGENLIVVDAETTDIQYMDIVMYTLHDLEENTDSTQQHKIKNGYSEQQLIEDFSEGRGGLTAYYSIGLQEYLYTAYEPVDINGWFILLSVPESVVLNIAENTKTILFRMGVFESIVLGLYFIRILTYGWKEIKAKESEMKQIQYMYDIQQILFDAYRQPENIKLSLKHIGTVTGAESVILVIVGKDKVRDTFLWNKEGAAVQEKSRQRQFVEAIVSHMFLVHSGYVVAKDGNREADQKALEIIRDFNQNNLMAIPIEGQEHQLISVLAAVNMRDNWDSTQPLSCLALSFSMALYNMKAYQTIEKMGITDSLTNLMNRNAYEQVLTKYETDRPDFLTCVYADANGLHELNNSQGHAAGDKMLQAVASALRDVFEEGTAYRIGGDEFLVFTEIPEDAAARYAAAVKEKAEIQGYHVSVGTASGGREVSTISIVKTAEQRMYEDKKQYYMGRGDRRKMR